MSTRDQPSGRRKRPARRKPTPPPQIRLGDYFVRESGELPSMGSALTGVLALVGTALIVTGNYLPYVRLDGAQVTPGISIWSVLGHVVLLALAAVAGGNLITRRAARPSMTALMPLVAIAPGVLVRAAHHGASPIQHRGKEYYFGQLHTTVVIEGLIGRTLVIIGCGMLLCVGVLIATMWSQTDRRDPVPLEGVRPVSAGAAGLSALVGAVALLVPEALTKVIKVRDPSGLVFTKELDEPLNVLGARGWGLVAGILLIAGLVAAGALVGSRSSRTSLVAGLVGLGAVLWWLAMDNARDVSDGELIVPGPRLFLLLAGAVLAWGAAYYAALVRQRGETPLLSGEASESPQ